MNRLRKNNAIVNIIMYVNFNFNIYFNIAKIYFYKFITWFLGYKLKLTFNFIVLLNFNLSNKKISSTYIPDLLCPQKWSILGLNINYSVLSWCLTLKKVSSTAWKYAGEGSIPWLWLCVPILCQQEEPAWFNSLTYWYY